MAEATVYVSDREVGVRWDDRGPAWTVDLDGRVSERSTPPPGSVPLYGRDLDAEVDLAEKRGHRDGYEEGLRHAQRIAVGMVDGARISPAQGEALRERITAALA